MTIKELKQRLERIDLNEALTQAIEATADQYLDLQREQFSEGERSDGSMLPPYSLQYAATRRREGLQTSVKDLRRTGAFYDAMVLEAFPDVVSITSDVEYEQWISYHYNKDGKLYGLNEANLVRYRQDFLYPMLKGIITGQTGLKWAA